MTVAMERLVVIATVMLLITAMALTYGTNMIVDERRH
jgi:hypothetical protein